MRLEGQRIVIDPIGAPLFDLPHENDFFQVVPGWNEIYVYARSRPDGGLEQARPSWDLGRLWYSGTWRLARALVSVPPRVWRGRTLVLVADSHFDGVDRAGQLLANYTGSQVVVATRQVWARDGVLVSASAALYTGPDGRLSLAPRAPADGQFLRRQPRRAGRPSVVTVLGPTLPADRGQPAWPGDQMTVLPVVNRTTPAGHARSDAPRIELSEQAAGVWADSERTPHGRSFYGQLPSPADRGFVLDGRSFVPPRNAYVLFRVADERVTPEVLAEVVAADPGWTGQPILLTICNAFDNSDPTAGVFLPLLQLFADALQTRAPQWTVEAIGASGLVTSTGDGRLHLVSEFTVPDDDDIRNQTTNTDRWYRVVGRRLGERVRRPEDLGATFASHQRGFRSELLPGVAATRVRSKPGPDRSWPAVLGGALDRADRWAVRLALPYGDYERLLEELRDEGRPEQELADRPEALVALRAYQHAPGGYDAAAGAGDADARSIIRAAAAAYTTVGLPSGRRWVRPRVLAGETEQMFEAAADTLAPGRSDLIVGVPGRPLPGFALPAVRAALGEIRPDGVLLAGRPSPDHLAWARQQIAEFETPVAYLDEEAALQDPAAALTATDQWITVTADAGAASVAGPGQATPLPAGMRLLAPSGVGDPRAEPWRLGRAG